MSEHFEPMTPEQALATSIGEYALSEVGTDGLHAMAVTMHVDGSCDLIIVPDHDVNMDEYIQWSSSVGSLNLLFHGEADIELRVMDRGEFHALVASEEPAFKKLASA